MPVINPPDVSAYTGYDPTGATASTAAFNSAWAANPFITAPEGDFLLDPTVLVAPANGTNNFGIRGAGKGKTRLIMKSGNATATLLKSPSFAFGAAFEGFSLTVQPTATLTGYISGTTLHVSTGGTGMAAGQWVGDYYGAIPPGTLLVSGSGATWVVNLATTVGSVGAPVAIKTYAKQTSGSLLDMGSSCDQVTLYDLDASYGYNGITGATCGYGDVSQLFLHSNANTGWKVLDTIGIAQWKLDDIWSMFNLGNGIEMNSTVAGAATECWTGCATGNNGGYGLYSNNIANIRCSDGFFGLDALGCVYVNGGHIYYKHLFSNTQTELSTGGDGFLFDTGVLGGATLANCGGTSNVKSGVLWNTTEHISITGGGTMNNGSSSPANFGGIDILTGTASIYGVQSLASGSQTWGLIVSAPANVQGSGNNIPAAAIKSTGTCNLLNPV